MSVFAGCADLQIGLERQAGGGYHANLSFTPPRSDHTTEIGELPLDLDLDRLGRLLNDEPQYRQLLTESLFAPSGMLREWTRAVTTVDALGARLRVRLHVGASAPELHAVRWELLGDRDYKFSPLFAGERCSLSRFISSRSTRPVPAPRGRRLRALFLAANPRKLDGDELGLPPIDIDAERRLVKTRFGSVKTKELVQPGEASAERLRAELRDEGYDILYLACHGGLIHDEAILYLMLPNGEAEIVTVASLAEWILNNVAVPPRLVVMASCRTAGCLSAAGPLLAATGVPALIGMQGDVTEPTSLAFFNSFFASLLTDGDIDAAVSAGRAAVCGRPDWWMPVLYSSLVEGRLWFPKAHHEQFTAWGQLLKAITRGTCLPVLGSGLVEDFLGSDRIIAQTWADKFDTPVAAGMRDQLPRVAQFLKGKGKDWPLEELENYYLERICAAGGGTPAREKISAAIGKLGEDYRKRHAPDIHDVLAQLPCRIFLCTKRDSLMADALTDLQSKEVTVKACPWDGLVGESPLYGLDKEYRPSNDKPLVYHLFGHLLDFSSIVLTEDNFFDHMIWMAGNQAIIPAWFKAALVDSTLLFLGFRLEDWEFRVLLRSIAKLGGGERLKAITHVAVQIDSRDDAGQAEGRVRHSLEEYFGPAAPDIPINIYWGSVQEFGEELSEKWQAQQKAR